MIIFIAGVLLAVWLGFHQISEHYRFDMVSDSKNGGVFIIDKKNSAINYCDNKSCILVGNGMLPSHAVNNPSAIMALQNAIMGISSTDTTIQAGQAPKGMKKNLVRSADHVEEEITDKENTAENTAHENEHDDEDHTDNESVVDEESEDDTKSPDGFDF